jgi:hypothetical protein
MNPTAGTKAEERWRLLNLRHIPARLNAEEAGWLLGFNLDEVGILIHHRILKPLGNPAQNGRKVFSRLTLQRFADDPEWLEKATKTVIQHWKNKNRPVVLSGNA